MSDLHRIILAFDATRVTFWGLVASLITSILFLTGSNRVQRRVHEPPSAPSLSRLPFTGHALGLLSRRMQYFADIGLKFREPIMKVSVLGTNIYVIGSVNMMPFIQRQPRVISSRSWFAKFVCTLVGCSEKSFGNFGANLEADSKGNSMLLEGVRTTKRILNSKTGTEMNSSAKDVTNKYFETLDPSSFSGKLDLFQWIKHDILKVVSETTYGPDNPFWDDDTASAFWEFEKDTIALCLTSFLPKFLVSIFLKGVRGREILVKALDNYLHNDERRAQGSPIVNAHFPLFQAKLDRSDVARFECANALGSFANTIPTSFWTIFHIFSCSELLNDIRTQIDNITTTVVSEDKITKSIDLRQLRSATVLFSTIEEVSRYRATGVGVRYVTEDTVVGEGEACYYLKKGGWMIIANQALHTDKRIWGKDADHFVADRFTRKVPHLSYRGFGNGASACCGKNFALHHIASFLAILVMKYDITPVDFVWEELGQDGRDTAGQVAGPVDNILVNITSREDGNVSWVLSS